MCGIIGAIAQRDVTPILLEGLKRLEYRGYDSAGIAVLNREDEINRLRTLGKVNQLEAALLDQPLPGSLGIAHTRWATHGAPSVKNAHPHICRDRVALVHNGIVENHAELRSQQMRDGHRFTSETDTEVIVHAIHDELARGSRLFEAVTSLHSRLQGAFALGVICQDEPDTLVAVRHGSPLVIGLGIGENFIASDVLALLPVTQNFIYLEEGDIAEITRDYIKIYDASGNPVQRSVKQSQLTAEVASRGEYRHFMQKEIFEQPGAISDNLEGRTSYHKILVDSLGYGGKERLAEIESIQIVACGTSYHAGLVAKQWIESTLRMACQVEVASEYRYRQPIVPDSCLFITISQSGETADTIEALRYAKKNGYHSTLTICNVPESTLTRESDLILLTRAGPEIGVASTKAFTTQLVSLLYLVYVFEVIRGLGENEEAERVQSLRDLPGLIERSLQLDTCLAQLADHFVDKHHALFLGRGELYPIAMEGALKLKEISYIHAEAYPAGELKHGPLALIDDEMPVIAVAPNNELLEKLKANLEEVRARGGELIVFADERLDIEEQPDVIVIKIPGADGFIQPIVFTIPLQLLAYHVAVIKGTDVDQPRNLAKSVTVE